MHLQITFNAIYKNKSQNIVPSLYSYACDIYLMNSKTGIDACSIDLFPLNIEPPDRWAHPLGTNSNHADIFGEVKSKGLQVAQEEPMR
jgi:hypothetical protein